MDSRKIPSYWLQLDEGDRDPATFFSYLGELAKQKKDSKDAPPLPFLTPDYLPDLTGFTRRFFRTLFSQLGRGAVLVLDNCQEAAGESFDVILREGLSEIPPGVSVIALSRTDVPTALARLRVMRQLAVIGAEQLRLTLDESREVAAKHDVSGEQVVAALHQQVDGWAAGLALLLMGGNPADELEPRITRATKETVFDYFAGEILDRGTPGEQEILVRTGIFPQFTLQMAMDISGDSEAGKLLQYLYRRQYFITRSSDNEPTYQYHDLFREFLLLRLEERKGAAELRRRAADILAARGEVEPAINLFIEGGDHPSAAKMIAAVADHLVTRGRWSTLIGWLDALPESLLSADPWLVYWRGVALLATDPLAAEQTLQQAYEGFVAGSDMSGQLFAAQASLDAINFQLRGFKGWDRWFPVLERMVPQYSFEMSDSVSLRIWCSFLAVAISRQPGHPLIETAVNRLRARLTSPNLDANERLNIGVQLIDYAYWTTDEQLGRETLSLCRDSANSEFVAPTRRAVWFGVEGVFFFMLGLWKEAREGERRCVEIAKEHGIQPMETLGRALHALFSLPLQNYEALEKEFTALAEIAGYEQFQATHLVMKGRAYLYAFTGRMGEALRWTLQSVHAIDGSGLIGSCLFIRLDMAAIHIEAEDLAVAERLIEEAKAIRQGTVLRVCDAQIPAVEAYLSIKRGQSEIATDKLREALQLVRTPALRGQFFCLGNGVPILLAHALNAGIEVDVVRQLIRDWQVLPPATEPEAWPWPVKIFALGRFEVFIDEVLLQGEGRAHYRVLELLKALVAFGGKDIGNELIADSLWPDADGDAAQASLKTTLHRLRRLLGREDAIRLHDNKLSINFEVCWLDVRAWESVLEAAKPEGGAQWSDKQLDASDQAMRLYRGALMANESQVWISSPRQRLRAKFLQWVERAGAAVELRGDADRAIRLYERALEADPSADVIYLKLMLCLKRSNRLLEAGRAFERCKSMMNANLGVEPSAEIRAVYESIRAETSQ